MMKRVAVIGAGAAGLAALRSLSKFKDDLKFVAFERSDRVGGTWIHNDPFKPTSMYDRLITNLPTDVMAYPGFPFSADGTSSFVGHKQVLEYLERFAEHYNLLQYIQFRTSVIEVDLLSSTGGKEEQEDSWSITVRNEENGNTVTDLFDSVILCNGHFADPYIPDLEGIDTFSGEVLHSHHYRSPSSYKDKVVLILGAGPSGVDIAADLVNDAAKIYLSHKNSKNPNTGKKIECVPGICKIEGADILLHNGRRVEADCILLATGYRYTFPFLTDKCHPVIRNEHVCSLYRMLVDIDHPSMYYIGLSKMIAPFLHFDIQTEYAVASITGQISQPSREEMEREYNYLYKKLVTDRGVQEKYFHYILDYHWEYIRELHTLLGRQPPSKAIENLHRHVHQVRLKDPVLCKQARYQLSEFSEQGFVVIYEPAEVQVTSN